MTNDANPTRSWVLLKDISSRAWEHPADRGALVALRKLQGFDTIIRRMSGLLNERSVRLLLLGSGVRVGPRQFPRVHRLYVEAASTLDVPNRPELYVQASPHLNAMTIGMDAPKILLNSALLDLMDDDELRFVLGHELGHAMSGHALYRTLLTTLINLTQAASAIPFSFLGMRMIMAAMMEWSRKAELSADRAGLLAGQNAAAALRVQLKLASGGHLEDLDRDEFLQQAKEYAATDDIRDSLLKLLLIEPTSHPFHVVRAGELRDWLDSGEYANILAGSYPRRQQDREAHLSAEAEAAASSYAAAFRQSEDALAKLLRDLGGGLGEFAQWMGDRINGPYPA